MPKKGRRREKEAECEWCFRNKTSWMSKMQEVDLISRISKGLFQKIPSEQVTRQRVEEGKGGGNSACESPVCRKQGWCVTLMKWAAPPNLTPLFPYTAPFLPPETSPSAFTSYSSLQGVETVLKRFFSCKPLSCQGRW